MKKIVKLESVTLNFQKACFILGATYTAGDVLSEENHPGISMAFDPSPGVVLVFWRGESLILPFSSVSAMVEADKPVHRAPASPDMDGISLPPDTA